MKNPQLSATDFSLIRNQRQDLELNPYQQLSATGICKIPNLHEGLTVQIVQAAVNQHAEIILKSSKVPEFELIMCLTVKHTWKSSKVRQFEP